MDREEISAKIIRLTIEEQLLLRRKPEEEDTFLYIFPKTVEESGSLGYPASTISVRNTNSSLDLTSNSEGKIYYNNNLNC